MHGKRALEAQADLAWQHWHEEVARWRRERNQCRAVLRELAPHPFRGNAGQRDLLTDRLGYRMRASVWQFGFLRRRGDSVQWLAHMTMAQATAPRPGLGGGGSNRYHRRREPPAVAYHLDAVALAKSHHRRERTYGGPLCSAKVRFEQKKQVRVRP